MADWQSKGFNQKIYLNDVSAKVCPTCYFCNNHFKEKSNCSHITICLHNPFNAQSFFVLFFFVFPVPHIHTLSLQAMLTSLQRGAISHPLQPVTFPSWVHIPEELQNVAVEKIMSWEGFLEKDFMPVSTPWRVSMDFLHGTITPSQTSRLKEDFTSAAAG